VTPLQLLGAELMSGALYLHVVLALYGLTELYVPHKLIFDKYQPNTFYPVDEMNIVSISWDNYKIIKNPTKEIITEEINKIIGFIKPILVKLKIKEIDKDFE
jgi:hypothetical protein